MIVVDIFDRLSAFLSEREGLPVPVFGETELSSQSDDQERIVVAPGGKPPTTDLGQFAPPETIGGGVNRSIARLDEVFRVYVSAYDKSDPDSQRLQYLATRRLFDVVFAGLFNSGRAFTVLSCTWQTGSIAAPFGLALLLVASTRTAITDFVEGDAVATGPVAPTVHERLVVPSLEEL